MFYVSRFKDVEKREYECEVVTPLFLGGANPKEAELRAPPVKAAMRFWWRALYEGGNIEQMAKEEAAIFGSTDKKAAVSVQLSPGMAKLVANDLPRGWPVPVDGKKFSAYIIEYLAFGLLDPKQKPKYIKKHFEEKSRFKIIVTFPKHAENDVVSAMKSLVSFGGLGARSRNGFGSIHCDDLIDYAFSKEGSLKPFTAFSQGTILFNQFNTYVKWEDALSEIGKVYRQARLDLEGKRHTWVKRSLIAMPIEAQNERNIPLYVRNGRHAKPYFLHVNKTSDGKYRGQILFLPYLYKAGLNDTTNRFKEYMDACGKMNESIAKGMGGEK